MIKTWFVKFWKELLDTEKSVTFLPLHFNKETNQWENLWKICQTVKHNFQQIPQKRSLPFSRPHQNQVNQINDKWTQSNFTSIEYTTISFPLLKQASTRRQIVTLTVMIRLQKQFDMRYELLTLLAPRLPPLNFKMADYDQKRTHHWKGGGAAVLFPSPGYSNTDNFPHSNPIHIDVQSLRKVFSHNQNQYAILERSKIIILKF